ncbi:PREDICTED: cactin-like, partial [Priapulus caudatus]|uniref:Splicing factor Cactin n=1 Tax=Priapulus caudatus TaxID=37621 RepID=A0ABM1DZ74_PRICU
QQTSDKLLLLKRSKCLFLVVYMELDDAANVDYWRDMTIVVEAELSNLRKLDPTAKEHVGDRREGINDAVRTDVVRIFKGKTYNQLEMLQQQILDKIRSGEEGIDIGYWESLLQQLKAHMARARLRDRHQELLRKKLFQLKQEQGVASGPLFPIIKTDESPRDEPDAGPGREASPDEMPAPSADDQPVAGDVSRSADAAAVSEAAVLSDAGEELDTGVAGEVEEGDVEDEATLQSYAECEAGGYEPTLLRETELDPGTVVADPFTDLERLQFKRHEVSEQGQVMSAEDAAFEREARKGMAGDEATFSVEVPLASTSYLWQDKYRPRKPRFFNRVHTGFEWNKYNQTHYDFDNPPPKIVQGYKFNIFYPDVIDKSSTPEYTLTPCSENKDFGILKFHAGPPYEDIGFKIVNREWEYSYKRGFRCQFANGIFQLWFHFKRYRYRR